MVSTKRSAVFFLFFLVFCVGCQNELERSVNKHLKDSDEFCDLLGKIKDEASLKKYSKQVKEKCREGVELENKMKTMRGPKAQVTRLEKKVREKKKELMSKVEKHFTRIMGIPGGIDLAASLADIVSPGDGARFRLMMQNGPSIKPPGHEFPKFKKPKIPRPSTFGYDTPKNVTPFHKKKGPTLVRPTKPLIDLAGKTPDELVRFFNYSEDTIATDAIRRVKQADPYSVSDGVRSEVAFGLMKVAKDTGRKSSDRCMAIEGMVLWGGQRSVPILVELLQETVSDSGSFHASGQFITRQKVILEALNKFQDRSDPETVAKVLCQGNGNMYAAGEYLARVGEPAEAVVIQYVRPTSYEVTKETVELLGKIGTTKSLKAFERLRANMPQGYAQVKDEVTEARKAIVARRKAKKGSH